MESSAVLDGKLCFPDRAKGRPGQTAAAEKAPAPSAPHEDMEVGGLYRD